MAGTDLAKSQRLGPAGTTTRGGVQVAYDLHGAGPGAVLLMPTWPALDRRIWKYQVPTLARVSRVVRFDPRGAGASGRPRGPEAYSPVEHALDALAVLDATDTAAATVVALSCAAVWALELAAAAPERVDGLIFIAPAIGLAPNHPERDAYPFEGEPAASGGWATYNARAWERDFPGFVDFFARKCFSEPHSEKGIEDFVTWALDTGSANLADATRGIGLAGTLPLPERCASVRCPTLVIHGDDDQVRPHAQGAALARATGGQLVTLSGAGHLPQLRHPAVVNRLLLQFLSARQLRARIQSGA